MPAWGYMPCSTGLRDSIARLIGYPHPLGRVAANIVCKYANFKSKHTLDIGCDTGIYTCEFLQRGVREVVSIDLDYQSLTVARENIQTFGFNASPLHSDAQYLPFRGNSFDQVLCLMVMEHVKNPTLLLSEISRILEPGGQLILSVPNELYLAKPIIPYDFSEILNIIGHKHAGYYLEDLRKFFINNGFMIQEYYYYNKFVSRILTEAIYIAIGAKRRKAVRTKMVKSSWLTMAIFLLVYPFLKLDCLDPNPRGGCIIVKAIKQN